jgi:hypothetical protein
LRQIVSNSGTEGAIVVEKIRECDYCFVHINTYNILLLKKRQKEARKSMV